MIYLRRDGRPPDTTVQKRELSGSVPDPIRVEVIHVAVENKLGRTVELVGLILALRAKAEAPRREGVSTERRERRTPTD